MPRITINKDKCKGCFLCVGVCPQGLLIAAEGLNLRGVKPVRFSGRAHSKSGKDCSGCSMCAIICPDCCIEVYR